MQRVPVMTCLKQIMLEKRLHLPRDRELENEMNGEISEQTKTGKTKFYHRSGTHDDRLWALALAVYAGRHDIVHYHPVGQLPRQETPEHRKNSLRVGPLFTNSNLTGYDDKC